MERNNKWYDKEKIERKNKKKYDEYDKKMDETKNITTDLERIEN